MNAVEGTIDTKIRELIASEPDMPTTFRAILTKDSVFTRKETILDVIYLPPDPEATEENGNLNAQMLIATGGGIIHVEDRRIEDGCEVYGVKSLHVLYNRIASVELDTCYLLGVLRIHTVASADREIEVDFNVVRHADAFEAFIMLVNDKMRE